MQNLNLEEELAEDYGDDYDALEDLSPEDQAAMDDALAKVLSTLGESEECGISERRMKEVLWDTYFDASATVNQLLEEKQRLEAQNKKRAGTLATRSWHTCVGLTADDTVRKSFQEEEAALPAVEKAQTKSPVSASSSAVASSPAPAPAPRIGGSSFGGGLKSTTELLSRGDSIKKPSKAFQKLQAYRDKKKVAAEQGHAAPLISYAQRQGTGASGSSTTTSTAPTSSSESSPTLETARTTPSGAALDTLFSHTAPPAPPTRFGQIAQLRLTLPPAPPSVYHGFQKTEADLERLRAAFSELSPDDRVLQARSGTRLGG